MMEVSPIPPGNHAFAQAMSRSSTLRLTEPASPSPVQRIPPPLAVLPEVFTETRDSLHLNPALVPNLTRGPQALHTISAGEGTTLSILCATVSGIVAITNQLDTVTTQLSALAKENGVLHTKLNDISSVLANEVATADDLDSLATLVRDLSHRLSAPWPQANTAPSQPGISARKTNQPAPHLLARPQERTPLMQSAPPTAPTPAPPEPALS